jgi:hypothetical protein
MLIVSILLAPLVAVIGWFVAYRSSVKRDRLNKRRDMIMPSTERLQLFFALSAIGIAGIGREKQFLVLIQ